MRGREGGKEGGSEGGRQPRGSHATLLHPPITWGQPGPYLPQLHATGTVLALVSQVRLETDYLQGPCCEALLDTQFKNIPQKGELVWFSKDNVSPQYSLAL